jgi:hypothetical protein
MSETSEISPEQAALDIKALNLFSRQNAALGTNKFASFVRTRLALNPN